MATYTLQQQVFALSMLSNAIEYAKGTPSDLEARFKGIIGQFFSNPLAQRDLGSWSIAWGPAVWEYQDSNVADNGMYVAKGEDAAGNPVYVVAVAATNGGSMYDQLTEDWDIALRPWPYALPAGSPTPSLTAGTLAGLGVLMTMQDPATRQTLQAFLAGVQDPGATLVFTGHSLGGALSPALALALFGAPESGTMSVAAWGAVYIYPTAGPTVGDQAYADFWNAVFPPARDAAGESWNRLIWNTLDVVPLAWAGLGQLNTLYPASHITWTPCLANIQAGLLGRVSSAGGAFVQPNHTPLGGTFAPWAGASASSPMVTYFITEMLHQHVWAYFDLLNVPGLRPLFSRIQDPATNAAAWSFVQKMCSDLVRLYCAQGLSAGQCGPGSAAVDPGVATGGPAAAGTPSP